MIKQFNGKEEELIETLQWIDKSPGNQPLSGSTSSSDQSFGKLRGDNDQSLDSTAEMEEWQAVGRISPIIDGSDISSNILLYQDGSSSDSDESSSSSDVSAIK